MNSVSVRFVPIEEVLKGDFDNLNDEDGVLVSDKEIAVIPKSGQYAVVVDRQ